MPNKLNRATSIGGPKATSTGESLNLGLTKMYYDDTESESSEEQEEEEKKKIVDYMLMPDK